MSEQPTNQGNQEQAKTRTPEQVFNASIQQSFTKKVEEVGTRAVEVMGQFQIGTIERGYMSRPVIEVFGKSIARSWVDSLNMGDELITKTKEQATKEKSFDIISKPNTDSALTAVEKTRALVNSYSKKAGFEVDQEIWSEGEDMSVAVLLGKNGGGELIDPNKHGVNAVIAHMLIEATGGNSEYKPTSAKQETALYVPMKLLQSFYAMRTELTGQAGSYNPAWLQDLDEACASGLMKYNREELKKVITELAEAMVRDFEGRSNSANLDEAAVTESIREYRSKLISAALNEQISGINHQLQAVVDEREKIHYRIDNAVRLFQVSDQAKKECGLIERKKWEWFQRHEYETAMLQGIERDKRNLVENMQREIEISHKKYLLYSTELQIPDDDTDMLTRQITIEANYEAIKEAKIEALKNVESSEYSDLLQMLESFNTILQGYVSELSVEFQLQSQDATEDWNKYIEGLSAEGVRRQSMSNHAGGGGVRDNELDKRLQESLVKAVDALLPAQPAPQNKGTKKSRKK